MPDPLDDTPAINEAARKALSKAAVACRRIGWFSFWTQLSLSIVSAGILLFSVAFTSQVRHSAGCPDLHTGLLLSGRLGGALAKGAGIWGTWVSIWSAMQNGPAVSLYLTLFGIVASFVSTFWSFGYTRLSRRLRGYLQGELRRVRKSDVIYTLQNGCWINILGMAATLLGLQARRSTLTPLHASWLWEPGLPAI